jgi:hypothetical protein
VGWEELRWAAREVMEGGSSRAVTVNWWSAAKQAAGHVLTGDEGRQLLLCAGHGGVTFCC